MSLIGCGSIHQGHERFSDDSRGRQEIFMRVDALLYEQFLPIREWGGATKSNFYLNTFHQQMVKLFEATDKNLHTGLSKEDLGEILAEIDDLRSPTTA